MRPWRRCLALGFAVLLLNVLTVRADLLVSSSFSNEVLRYDASGGFLGAFTAPGAAQEPEGLAIGPDDNLYVSTLGPNDGVEILRFGPAGGAGSVFVPEILGSGITDIIFDPGGSVLIASDYAYGVLRVYDARTGAALATLTTPSGPPTFGPDGLAFGPDGNLYISNLVGGEVLKYDVTSGTFSTFVAAGTSGFLSPYGLTFGPDGNLYVSSVNTADPNATGMDSVLRFNGSTGSFIDAFVPAGAGGLETPVGLVFGPDGDLFVSSYANDQVLRYQGPNGTNPGQFVSDFVPAGAGGLARPTYLLFTPVPIPEPGSLTLVGLGLIGVLGTRRRRRRSGR